MNLPACLNHSELFDATDAASHARAKAMCATCPTYDWCLESLRAARRNQEAVGTENGPLGTWAGIRINTSGVVK